MIQHTPALPPPGTSAADELVFLGNAPASAADRRKAWIVSTLLVVVFWLGAPHAARTLPAYPSFVPTCDALLIVLNAITALLLHAQYRQLGERSFLALACGYLFAALLAAAHALSFPDAFVPGRVIGDAQTTAWLWMGWHGLFPASVGTYALLARRDRGGAASLRPPALLHEQLAFGGTLLLSLAVVVLATYGERLLPRLMIGSRYAPRAPWILAAAWSGRVLAVVLSIQRTGLARRIDVWLTVSLLSDMIDLALSAVLVTGRYQLGFYFGRIFGLLGSSFVLLVLLRETVTLYGAAVRSARRLAQAQAALRCANDTLEARVAARTADLEAGIQERKGLALRLATAQEEERKRFARELHDSIGQLIAALSFAHQSADSSGELGPRAATALSDAQRLTVALGKEMHALAVRLRPTSLDDVGLAAALRQLVDDWSARTGVRAEFEAVGVAGQRFATEIETSVYRVVQEALTNVAKHAAARRLSVVVTRPEQGLSVVIEDDGRGFEPAAAAKGRLGLLGMRERAELLGGSLEVESRRGAGTTVVMRIPVATAACGVARRPDEPWSGAARLP